MRFLKSFKTLVVCIMAIGACAFSHVNAQEQVEVSDTELNKIASAFQDIQKVNMEAQQQVMKTVEESGFEANRFNEMYQASASPEKRLMPVMRKRTLWQVDERDTANAGRFYRTNRRDYQ